MQVGFARETAIAITTAIGVAQVRIRLSVLTGSYSFRFGLNRSHGRSRLGEQTWSSTD
jgi:hypothetical protein